MALKIDSNKVSSVVLPNLAKSNNLIKISMEESRKLRSTLPISFEYYGMLILLCNDLNKIKDDIGITRKTIYDIVNTVEQIERKKEAKFNDLSLDAQQITIPHIGNSSEEIDSNISTSSIDGISESDDENESLLSKIAEELRDCFRAFFIDGENSNEFLNYDYIKFDYSEIEKDGYVVQGVTTIEGKYVISAYKKDEQSRIYIYNNLGKYEGNITLDSKAHVGGVTYDKSKNILFVAGASGTVDAYNYNLILASAEEAMKENIPYTLDLRNLKIANDEIKIDQIKFSNNQKIMENTVVEKTSTIYFDGGYLYAATCSGVGPGELVRFKVNYNEEKNCISYVQEGNSISIPEQTQGIAVTKYKDKEYLILSQSLGKHVDSRVILYEFDKNKKIKEIGKYYTSIEGYEGVQVSGDKVIFVSEFSEKNVVTTMDKVIERAKKNEKTFGNYITDIASFGTGIGYEVLSPAWEGLKDSWGELKKGNFKSAVSELNDGLESSWEGLKDTGGEIIRDNFGEGTAKFVSKVVNKTEDIVVDVYKGAKTGIKKTGAYITKKAKALWKFFT